MKIVISTNSLLTRDKLCGHSGLRRSRFRAASCAGSTTPSTRAAQFDMPIQWWPEQKIKDWAARRVGFAKADHSQDGEVEGAIDSPEAQR